MLFTVSKDGGFKLDYYLINDHINFSCMFNILSQQEKIKKGEKASVNLQISDNEQ